MQSAKRTSLPPVKPAQPNAKKPEHGDVVDPTSNNVEGEVKSKGEDDVGSEKGNFLIPPNANTRRRSSTGSHPGTIHSGHRHGKSQSGFLAYTKKKLSPICRPFWNYLQRMFTIPLVPDPISYWRTEDFTTAGDRIYNINEHENEQNVDMIEAACNYSEETGAVFHKILQQRKERALRHTMAGNLDFSLVPPWNDSMLDRLQCIFQIFDETGDGLIAVEEMSNMMIDFGDKSTEEERQKVFQDADTRGVGLLNFNEFVLMLHNVTVKSPDSMPPTIVETFRLIDRNMARIRGLDVVQQLQAGLF